MPASVGRNWAGNLSYSARELIAPDSVNELAETIRREPRLRVLGSRHCFTDIADTDGVLVSLASLAAAPIELDEAAGTVRVPAGARYGEIAPTLDAAGFAVGNLASLPHISVAGAVQTGTHGSGDRSRSLAGQVAAVEMLGADGEPVVLRRGDTEFDGAVVALGALGVVTHVHLEVEPRFELAQTVYDGGDWDAILGDLDAVTSAARSVSLFTTWRDPDRVDLIWTKHAATDPGLDAAALGARPADGPRHPIAGVDPSPATEQGGVLGPWYERLPHFRLAFTPSAGAELQTEYLVARADAVSAIEALRRLAARIAPLLLVAEVRTIARDELWLSPAQGRDTVGLHFTWRPDQPAVEALLPTIEEALPPSARPHWGKLFTMEAETVRERYPRWDDFRALRARRDPEGRFTNAYLRRLGI
ncbi:D-arabinono-1,4-lactone oxidase [Microbacterium sp. SORGH_AS_0888]|uniref:D-arabinono-1,4-lactone oxidase n=1 Tax=Microbacterium sp. SORGH_AS_0888 TaxID=3041791 RepID=UPI002788B7E2|nr:D-arabinono-1,4-lactone oxidase [Microbacterium sp. SORGH_AS_0888]MDQ1129327.1 xylitol oxidase [Microbacterium sp. SORGH_AS_0888]